MVKYGFGSAFENYTCTKSVQWRVGTVPEVHSKSVGVIVVFSFFGFRNYETKWMQNEEIIVDRSRNFRSPKFENLVAVRFYANCTKGQKCPSQTILLEKCGKLTIEVRMWETHCVWG